MHLHLRAVGRPGLRRAARQRRPEDEAAPQRRDLRRMWRAAIAAGADRVTITSYNEWHEGTQIEPAASARRGAARTATSPTTGPGASTGCAAEYAYLARTRYWSDVLRNTSPAQPKHQAVVDVRRRDAAQLLVVEVDRSRRATSRAPSAAAPSSEPKQRSESTEMTPRLPVWRRAIPSSSRSSSSGSMRTFESEPMQRPISRWQTRATGRKPSPRLASVVGQAQMREPASRRRSSSWPSACVACTTVERGPRQPARASSSIGRRPCSAQALVDLARLLVGVDVQRQLVLGARSARARSSASAGQARTEWGATPTRIPSARSCSSSREVLGHRVLPEAGDAAAQVARVEADERDPRLLGRLGRRAGLLEAEVVELADRRVAVRAQLAVHLDVLAADLVDGQRLGERDHRLAPGPEVAAAGAAAQSPLERVAVRVHEAGYRERRHARILSGVAARTVSPQLAQIPNALTLFRLALIPPFVVLILQSGGRLQWAAGVIFLIAGITDQVDGFLARRWHVESAFGKIADPLADRLMIGIAVILEWHAGRLPCVALADPVPRRAPDGGDAVHDRARVPVRGEHARQGGDLAALPRGRLLDGHATRRPTGRSGSSGPASCSPLRR